MFKITGDYPCKKSLSLYLCKDDVMTREIRSMIQLCPMMAKSPLKLTSVTALAGLPRIPPSLPPASLDALVDCLFPTARPLTVTPVLMDRLPRPTNRPDDLPPSDYKLDRRGYTCLGSLLTHLGLKGSLIVGTVMNAAQTKPEAMCIRLATPFVSSLRRSCNHETINL